MVEEKNNKYTLSEEDERFFNKFAEKHFGPPFDIEEFLTLLDKQSKKLLIDTAIFITHPRVNKYAGKYIKSNRLDKLIIDLRKEFEEILGNFKKKLSDKEKIKFNDYWYGKELFRTLIFLLIYTININLRNKEDKTLNDYALKLISETKLDEQFYKPMAEIFQFITTYGDIFEFYSRSYVDDFEFLFGNYIDPISHMIKNVNTKFKHRQHQIEYVVNYKEEKYEKLFGVLNSSLRNGLAHRIHFVNEEKNNIVFENFERELEEIKLEELEDKAFRLNIISYMLAISDKYLLKSNNIAIKHIKAITRDMFCKPKDFFDIWDLVISAISELLEKDPKNSLYAVILRKAQSFILKRFILFLIQSLNMFDLIGTSFILQFTYHFYQFFDTELNNKDENEFIQNMKLSFDSIKMPEDTNMEKEIKRFIKLIILKFIEIKPKGIETLKKLYDEISI